MKSAKRPATPRQCRMRAKVCEKLAGKTSDSLVRSAMLQMAKQWRALAERRRRTAPRLRP
jgi:hypothetical protein